MAWKINIVIFTILSLVVVTKQDTEYYRIRIVILSKEIHLESIKQSFEKDFFYDDSKINDNIFIFVKGTETPNHRLSLSKLATLKLSNKHIEKLAQSYRMYATSPPNARSDANGSETHQTEQWNAPNGMFLCTPYFDQALGIDHTRIKYNVSGRGIVVGVTDVGIDANNMFIRGNVERKISDFFHNFSDNISQTGPAILPDTKESSLRTSHAMASAGLIARPKTGDECVTCGIGVAPDAKVADLQMPKIGTSITQSIDSADFVKAIASGLRLDNISIFSNSWATSRAFKKSDFYEVLVLTNGMREGLGAVSVFPAGQPGSGLANHIGSITVACLGVNGTVADVSAVNAATLVSVFCNGRKRNDETMITVGQDEKRCETSFGGESAATAIVSGMIALLLEANPGLSARDVKHILIESSSHLWIESTPEFVINTAGIYYHPNVGFGLPDSSKMVLLGRYWNELPPLCTRRLTFSKAANQTNDLGWYVQGLYDNTLCDTTPCIEKMEEVLVEIEFVYSEQHHMRLLAKSPSGTESTLANIKPFKNGEKERHVSTTFRSNHFWGENSEGLWRVNISCNSSKPYSLPANGCHVVNTRLVIHGTMVTGYKQKFCNDNTSEELDVDNKNLSTDASDVKHVKNIFNNKIITKTVVLNNNESLSWLWDFLGNFFAIVVLMGACGYAIGKFKHHLSRKSKKVSGCQSRQPFFNDDVSTSDQQKNLTPGIKMKTTINE